MHLQVKIFAGCPRDFFKALVMKLQPCICVAGDYVFKLGEKGAAKLLYTWLLSGKHLAVTEAHRKHVEGKLKKC